MANLLLFEKEKEGEGFWKDGKINESCSYNVMVTMDVLSGESMMGDAEVEEEEDVDVEDLVVQKFKRLDVMGGPSLSAVVSWLGSVFVIGGADSSYKPKTDVVVYSFSPQSVGFAKPLISGKVNPIAVPTLGGLYVFSNVLKAAHGPPPSSSSSSSNHNNCLEEDFPRCEFLLSPNAHWLPIDLPLDLPRHNPSNEPVFCIDAYAPTYDGVYVNIKSICSYYVCCYAPSTWTKSLIQLPFYGEAKMMPVYDRCYCALVRETTCVPACFAVYKLVPDTDDEDVFHFDKLAVFSPILFPNQYLPEYFSDDWLFKPLSPDTISVIHSCESPLGSRVMVAQILKLSWSFYNEDGNVDCVAKEPVVLWQAIYRNMPLHDNWCILN